MGLNKNESLIYLKIADGKIRMKTNDKDPEAVQRKDEINNKIMYERVYSSCAGFLMEVREQIHEEYGTVYSLILLDPTDGAKYSLQFSDQSRYFPAFVQRFPLIDFSKPIVVKPFSFKQGDSNAIGLSIKQDGNPIANYYKEWDEETETSTPMNGLEKFDFSEAAGDKDEMKILRIKFIKFMKQEFHKWNKNLIEYWKKNPIPTAKDMPKVEAEAEEEKQTTEDAEIPEEAKKVSPGKSKPSAKKKAAKKK